MQVGGVDQLLELVETGVGVSTRKAHSYPLALYYGEEDAPEVGVESECMRAVRQGIAL